VHRPVWFEHAAQGLESRIRVGKMMEDTGARNFIERRPQLAYALEGQLVHLKVV
jgi:hypothetical protein